MLYKRLIINGKEYLLAVSQAGTGAPAATDPGSPGILYMDTDTGDLYKCTGGEDGAWEWKKLSEGGSGYKLPIGGEQLGGVKNGGNVVINADGTMTAPEAGSIKITGTENSKIAPTGTILDNGTEIHLVSQEIRVNPGEQYLLTCSANFGNSLYAIYESNGTKKENLEAPATEEGRSEVDLPVTIPSGGAILRVAWNKQVTDTPYSVTKIGNAVVIPKVLDGVTVAVIGDSLVEKNNSARVNFVDILAAETGATITNLGVGGTGYMAGQDEGKAFYQRAEQIPDGTERVLIYGSGNDRDKELGEPADTGTDTLCGCINATIDAVYERVPAAWVGIIAPAPWKEYPPYGEKKQFELMVQAQQRICARRGIPFLDLYHASGLRPWDDTFRELAFDAEGVHPNDTGHALIAPQIQAFLMGAVGGGAVAPVPDSSQNANNQNICSFLDAYVAWKNGEKFPVAFYGDSTFAGHNTSGDGYTFCDVLQTLLRTECGNAATVYRVAVSGTNLDNGINKFNSYFGNGAKYADTKMLGIGFGINDRLSYSTYEDYKNGVYTKIETLIGKCFASGIQPFLVTSQATLECGVRSDYVTQYPLRYANAINVCANGAKKELAKKYNIPLIDLNRATEVYLLNSNMDAKSICSDLLHFGDVGHQFEAGFLFSEMVSRVIHIEGTSKTVLSYASQNLMDGVPQDKLSFGGDFKLYVNYEKANTGDIRIFDAYVYVRDYPATLLAYKKEGGLTYAKIDDTKYSLTGTENYICDLDIGLHHLEVYTGASTTVNFSGFIVNGVFTENFIPVENVSLNHDTAELAVGETLQLAATVYPENATNRKVIWTAGNSNCSVSADGLVTANEVGSCTIIATTSDGGKTAECAVTIVESEQDTPDDGNILSGVTFSEGGILPSDGTEYDSDSRIRSNYFDVSEYQGDNTFWWVRSDEELTATETFALMFYDSGYNFKNSIFTEKGKQNALLAIPDDAVFARLRLPAGEIKGVHVYNDIVELTDHQTGHAFSSTTGEIIEQSKQTTCCCRATATPGETYICHTPYHIVGFDTNGTFVKLLKTNSDPEVFEFTVPDGIVGLGITYDNSKTDTQQVCLVNTSEPIGEYTFS